MNDNPLNLSQETLAKLAAAQQMLVNGYLAEAERQADPMSIRSFPLPAMPEYEDRLVKDVQSICGTCQLRYGLLRNIGLCHDVYITEGSLGESVLVIDIRGIHTASTEVWRERFHIPVGKIQLAYAADSLLRFHIDRLYEGMVRHLEEQEKKIKQGR